jgi:hypothetical protein
MRAQVLLAGIIVVVGSSCGTDQEPSLSLGAPGLAGGSPVGSGDQPSKTGGASNRTTSGGGTNTSGTSSTGGDGPTGGTRSGSGGSTPIGGTRPSGGTTPASGMSNSGGNTPTGGASNRAGTQNAVGGSQNVTGGTQNVTGGAQNATGGNPNATGGNQNATGGNPNATGGNQNATGGIQNATGGAQNAGTPTLRSSTSDPTYATSGPWHGYIWPAVDSGGVATISPSAAEGFKAGGPPFCVQGHVPATSNSTAVAMVGMNTNQAQSGGAVAAQWTPTGVGILVNVSNPGGSPLRLQIQTNETGAIATLWCSMLTVFDQDVIVLWSDFNTRCWDNSGTGYDQSMAGIATVMVLVPGTAQAGGYDFNFCVNDMTPV